MKIQQNIHTSKHIIDTLNIIEKNFKEKFDIIFLDPPYDYKILSKCLKYIYELNLLNDNGIVILEYENEHIDTTNYNEIKDKKYGSKYVKIVEKI